MRNANLVSALAEWRRAIGSSRVTVATAALEDAADSTYELKNRVTAIVRPRNRADVERCVRIATRNRVPIYPISRGQNFGYGSAAPSKDQSAILDLSSMTRIEMNRDLATVTVEPGVTTTMVAEYVAKRAPELLASLPLHTSFRASALGNALDGGIGTGLHGDRFAYVYSLEVVLGTGEVIHTGMDRWEGGELLGHTEARVGPSIRDLFMQSNFGVVTRMTFGLFSRPRDFRQLLVDMTDQDDLILFLEKIRPLLRSQVLTPAFSIHNEHCLIPSCLHFRYPWLEARERTPLPRTLIQEVRVMMKGTLPRLGAVIDLWSPDARIGAARERVVREALPNFTILGGSRPTPRDYWKPGGLALPLLYWRTKRLCPADGHDVDPHRDGCGFMWCDFVMPMDSPLLAKIWRDLESLVRSYGLDPSISAHTFWPRTFFLVVNLAYDRSVPGEDMRAEKCDRAMTAYLARYGVLPGRRRVGSMDLLPRATDDSAAVFARIKKAVDPAGVISPGRYESVLPSRSNPRPGERAFAVVEQIHQDLIDQWSEPKKKRERSKGIRPLRAHFMERATYERALDAARSLLSLLKLGAREVVRDGEWRELLGVDDKRGLALDEEIDRAFANATLEGAFDSDGEYKVFDVDLSPRAIRGQPVGRKSSRAGWRSPMPTAGITVTPRYRAGKALDNLAWAALLASPKARPALKPAEVATIERHVPWTRIMRDEVTTYRGKRIRLGSFVRDNPERFVLRPLHRGAAPTLIGPFIVRESWNKAIQLALKAPSYIVQERVRIHQEVFPLACAGVLEFEGCFVGTDIVFVGGKPRGCIVRIAERPKVGARCASTYVVPAFVSVR